MKLSTFLSNTIAVSLKIEEGKNKSVKIWS